MKVAELRFSWNAYIILYLPSFIEIKSNRPFRWNSRSCAQNSAFFARNIKTTFSLQTWRESLLKNLALQIYISISKRINLTEIEMNLPSSNLILPKLDKKTITRTKERSIMDGKLSWDIPLNGGYTTSIQWKSKKWYLLVVSPCLIHPYRSIQYLFRVRASTADILWARQGQLHIPPEIDPIPPKAYFRMWCFSKTGISVVVNFLSQVIFIFLLFLGMLMYANEV